MASHAALHRMNTNFYKDYPEFKNHKEVVASVVEMEEGKDPTAKLEDIFDRSVPEIRNRLALMEKLNPDAVLSPPNRDMRNLSIPNPNGEV